MGTWRRGAVKLGRCFQAYVSNRAWVHFEPQLHPCSAYNNLPSCHPSNEPWVIINNFQLSHPFKHPATACVFEEEI